MQTLHVDSEFNLSNRSMRSQKFQKIKQIFQLLVLFVFLGLLVFYFLNFISKYQSSIGRPPESLKSKKISPRVPIVDVGKNGLTENIIVYSDKLEKKLSSLGVKVEKIILPADKTRELHIYINSKSLFYKVNIMRPEEASALDISYMEKYIENNKLKNLEYIDLRIPRKSYYKIKNS